MVELISVHLPKTAGTTFGKILTQIYKPHQICYDYPNLPESTTPLTSETKVIHGHFYGNKYDAQFPQAKKIIWLRHPISRLISYYFFWKTHPKGKVPLNMDRISLVEFSETPETRNQITTTVVNLNNFYFVGIQELFAEDIAELAAILGWSNIDTHYENTNPFPEYYQYCEEIWSDQITISHLAISNHLDMELYEKALELRATRRGHLNGLNQIYQCFQTSLLKIYQLQNQQLQAYNQLSHIVKQLQNLHSDSDVIHNHLSQHYLELLQLQDQLSNNIENYKKSKISSDIVWKGTNRTEKTQSKTTLLSEIAAPEDINYCYRLFLEREPDHIGQAYWIERIKNEKLCIEDLVLKFITSEEFIQSNYKNTGKSVQSLSKELAQQYIYYCHRLLLGIQPEQTTMMEWENRILSEELTIRSLVNFFLKMSDFSVYN
jgi:hypothetical protein